MIRCITPVLIILQLLFAHTILSQSGNVGIGVDTPQARLDVAGKLKVDSFLLPQGANAKYVLTSDSSGNGSWQSVFNIKPNFSTKEELDVAQDPFYLALNDTVAFIAHHQIGEIRSYDLRVSPPSLLHTFYTGVFPSHISLQGDILVIAELLIDSLILLDVNDPASMFQRDAFAISPGTFDLATKAGMAILANAFDDNLQFFNIEDPDSIYLDTVVPFSGNPIKIEMAGNNAYVLDNINDLLHVLDISDLHNISVTGTLAIGTSPSHLRLNGNLAYIVDGGPSDSLHIADISNPDNPNRVGKFALTSSPTHIDVVGDLAFVADNALDVILVVDCSDPANPVLCSSFSAGTFTSAIEHNGEALYVLDQLDDFLRIIDFGPSLPMVDALGNISPFDQVFKGRLEITSPVFRDHLRLSKPDVASVDLTINDIGLSISTEDTPLLFSRFSDGNLGVGVTNPSHKLHIRDGSVLLGHLGQGNETNDIGFLLGRNFSSPSFGMVYELDQGVFDNEEKLHFKKYIQFDTVSLMTIQQDGNVGIGTTTPDVKLEVLGSIQSNGGNVSVKDGLQQLSLKANAAEGYVQIDVGGSGHSTDDIILGDALSPSNKVGIGTSTPGTVVSNTMLEVKGGHIIVGNNFGLLSQNSGGTGLGAGIDTRTDDGLGFYAGGALKMTIVPLGWMGIGTSSPDADLEIRDAGSSYMRITSTNNAQIGLDLVRSGTSSSDYRIANNGGILEIQESVNINGVAPSAYYGFTKSSFRPNSSDLNLDLGISGKRWRDVNITGAVNSSSDRRLKQDIRDLNYGLEEILQLRPVKYAWIANPDHEDLGLIAQEVETIIPHVVKTPENADEYYSINYPELVPVLIKAIQEQQALIDELNTQNAHLQTLVTEGQAEMNKKIDQIQMMLSRPSVSDE